MLLQKFYDEASQEVMKERYAPPQVEDYCTEYDGNYKIPGFEVEKEPFKKFPEVRYILHQYLFFYEFQLVLFENYHSVLYNFATKNFLWRLHIFVERGVEKEGTPFPRKTSACSLHYVKFMLLRVWKVVCEFPKRDRSAFN